MKQRKYVRLTELMEGPIDNLPRDDQRIVLRGHGRHVEIYIEAFIHMTQSQFSEHSTRVVTVPKFSLCSDQGSTASRAVIRIL